VSALALLLVASWAAVAPDSLVVASSRGERQIAVRSERGYPAVAAADLGTVLSLETAAPRAGAVTVRAAGRSYGFVLDAAYFTVGRRIYGLAAPAYVVRDSLFVPLQFLVEYLPRLAADRYRYDPARSRLEELPAPAMGTPEIAAAQPRAPAVAAAPGRSTPAPAPPPPHRRVRHVVALDPGHGGPDVGMLGPLGRRPFLREKDVTLAVARALADELRRRGVEVVLTRTKDTLIALADRGRIAAADSASLFVSIHVNAANPHWRHAEGTRGFETYFLAEARTEDARRVEKMENESVRFETDAKAQNGDPMRFILNDLAQNEHLRESSRLAAIVEDSLKRVHPAEARGVKQAGFAVLATSYMPAVLVEVGYGSNDAEARFLTSQSGQRQLARGIAGAVVGYLAEYDRRLAGGAGGGSQR
jgi:N-acetylmuramoyl-L-alanine amidase